jgi:hypothetical protein
MVRISRRIYVLHLRSLLIGIRKMRGIMLWVGGIRRRKSYNQAER